MVNMRMKNRSVFDQNKYYTYARSVYREAYGKDLKKENYCISTLIKIIKSAELHIMTKLVSNKAKFL